MSGAPPRASSRANGYDERPRGAHAGLKSERPEAAAKKAPSPQPGYNNASTSHKRTASGNPRPLSRTTTTEERRHEERRVTERTFETHLERLIPRAASPQRRQAEKKPEKRAEMARSKSHEKETRAETPSGEQCGKGSAGATRG